VGAVFFVSVCISRSEDISGLLLHVAVLPLYVAHDQTVCITSVTHTRDSYISFIASHDLSKRFHATVTGQIRALPITFHHLSDSHIPQENTHSKASCDLSGIRTSRVDQSGLVTTIPRPGNIPASTIDPELLTRGTQAPEPYIDQEPVIPHIPVLNP